MHVNNKAAGHVVSASMMIVAAQAMAHTANGADRILQAGDGDVDADTRARIVAAIAKPDFKRVSAQILPMIANGFGTGDKTIAGSYQVAGNFDTGVDSTVNNGFYNNPLNDRNQGGSTQPGTAATNLQCYSNCYANCYYACHGSRGWR